jgi:hypothetical protein
MADQSVPAEEAPCACAVFMVRPARFAFNRQTARTNAFQQPAPASPPDDLQDLALREFTGLAERLDRAGVGVIVADDTPEPAKPDAVFPNNWVSFHADGTVVLYPMLAANRRLERRAELLDAIAGRGWFDILRTLDLSQHEARGRYLEGTGSLVLDRPARVAYASWSPRTDPVVLDDFARQLGYETLAFEAVGADGRAVYHTNVVMGVGARFAVFCGAAIVDLRQRRAVVSRLEATGHHVIDISPGQMQAFGANLLELKGSRGPVIALSTTAWAEFEPPQRRMLEQHGELLAADIPTIERIGGGGVRCMLAEIHLPKRGPASMS